MPEAGGGDDHRHESSKRGFLEQVTVGEIEHMAYCRRQWGLISLDDTWQENRSTAIGQIVHERVDDSAVRTEGGRTVVRAMAIWSDQHGLIGRADAVELGGGLPPLPVEYKSGRRLMGAAVMQVAAQALCLEEMFSTPVVQGAIWLHGSRRRVQVKVTSALKRQVLDCAEEIRISRRGVRLPDAQYDARCRDCSLINECLPALVTAPRRIAGIHAALFAPYRPVTEHNA